MTVANFRPQLKTENHHSAKDFSENNERALSDYYESLRAVLPVFFILSTRILFSFLISPSLTASLAPLLRFDRNNITVAPSEPRSLRGGPLVKNRVFGDSPAAGTDLEERLRRGEKEEKRRREEEVIPRDFPLVTSRTDTRRAR